MCFPKYFVIIGNIFGKYVDSIDRYPNSYNGKFFNNNKHIGRYLII